MVWGDLPSVTDLSLLLVHISNWQSLPSSLSVFWIRASAVAQTPRSLWQAGLLHSFIELLVCDWQQHDANACNTVCWGFFSPLHHTFRSIQSVVWKKGRKPLKLNLGGGGHMGTSPASSHRSEWFNMNIVSENSCCVLLIFFPFVESVTVTTPSQLPSLSALLLLVPLVAGTVGVLLWRQKHISDHGESSCVFFSDSFFCSVHRWPLSAEWCGPWHPLGLL